MYRLIIILVFFSQLLLQTAAAKNEAPMAWRVRDIAGAPAERIKLRDSRNRVIGTLETKQLLLIYSAMAAIQEAAEINAELFIVEGKEPNAFATVARKS